VALKDAERLSVSRERDFNEHRSRRSMSERSDCNKTGSTLKCLRHTDSRCAAFGATRGKALFSK